MISPAVTAVFSAASPLTIFKRVASAVGAGDSVDEFAVSDSCPWREFVTAFPAHSISHRLLLVRRPGGADRFCLGP